MLLTLAAYFFFMWRIHPSLTVACLSVTVRLWWVTQYYSGGCARPILRNRELYDGLVLSFSESVRGMQTVKGFAAEPHQVGRFEAANDGFPASNSAFSGTSPVHAGDAAAVATRAWSFCFAYGGWLYVQGGSRSGAGWWCSPGCCSNSTGRWPTSRPLPIPCSKASPPPAASSRCSTHPSEVENQAQRHRPGAARRADRLRKGHLRLHAGHGRAAATSRSRPRPGQVIGIFGMTGAGKSSLLGLIPRFYDPQRGRILADGHDLRDLDLDAYRRQIGIVYQESFLFSNTVAANIAFGNPHATQAQIEQAARLASAHEFIMALPHGYQTVLGEAGVDLSGGQRQRLALARALLLATAHADPGRSDGVGGSEDGARNCVRAAPGHGGADDLCGFQPAEPAAAGGRDPGAGTRAAWSETGHARRTGARAGPYARRRCCN